MATTPVVVLVWVLARARRGAAALLGAGAAGGAVRQGALEGLGAFVVLNLAVAPLLAGLFDVEDVQRQLRSIALGDGLSPVAVVTLVLLAPLGEELLYRGLLYRGLRNRLAVLPAVVGSAVIFGLVHLEPLAIVVTGLLGAQLAWLFERRRHLLAPLTAHAVFNALGVLALAAM